MILKSLFYVIKKLLTLPFNLIKKIFKNPKSQKKSNYVNDIDNLIKLNLPISVVTLHFDEENGFRYDITSTIGKKALERAKNENNSERESEVSSLEEEKSEKSENTTIKKKVGRPKGSTKKTTK